MSGHIAGTLAVLGSALLAAGAAAQEFDCFVVDALVPGYALRETYLWDINDAGVAIGTTTGQTSIGSSDDGVTGSQAAGSVSRPLSWPHGISNTLLSVGVGIVHDLNSGQTWNLPLLPGTYITPYPQDVSDAGVAVGYVQICNCSNSAGTLQIPYVWDAASGARTLNIPGATGLSRVNANHIAIGWLGGNSSTDSFFVDLATGQYTLMSTLVPNTGPGAIKALDINDHGVIVGSRAGTGTVYHYGYRYSPITGAQLLPLPAEPYQQAFTPTTINNAGQIAGQIYILGSPRSCIYDEQHGIRDLNDPALVAGIPAGFTLMYTSRINSNGWIVGYGNGGGGMSRSFVLVPRGAGSCYANCDSSTASPLLTANDFQCFLNAFAAGNPYANCDQSTGTPTLTANDFQCFLNQYAAGCP